MPIDEDKVHRLASELRLALSRLGDLSRLSEEAFLSDPHKVGSAKYHFVIAIEAAIDLCNHVISKRRWRTPEDYADSFRVMGENRVFEPEMTARLVEMAKFRNRLVHLYWDIDDRQVFRILRGDRGDLDVFLDQFGRLIESDLPGPGSNTQ